ncbi:MAG: hypothetical protein SGJ00_07785 [bacterium]|nr:hypothetical protein [bacterium]
MNNEVFVYVVCGTKEHLDTLQLSLSFLKKYSKNDVYVLTDSARNEFAISHSHIIDIQTPAHLNHHQASIFLKTGIHNYLPKGNTYCYLDTDVVAVSTDCDDIFSEFIAPIRFAPDHCKVRKFSSYAVNCNCLLNREIDRNKFQQFMQDINGVTITEPHLLAHAKELQYEFDQLKKSFIKRAITALRFLLSYPVFKFNSSFQYHKKTRTWHIQSGEVIMYEMDIAKMQHATGLTYNKWNKKWYNKQGEDIWHDECDHLIGYIKNTFDIEVKEENWQHWNGGVFLFNNKSHEFLDAWHQKTMHIFTLKDWKTRDQGTLIATAWEFGLANHPTLSKRFNFIADYYNNGLQINPTTSQITDDGFEHSYSPAMVHVYHHWEDKTWNIWQWIETKI